MLETMVIGHQFICRQWTLREGHQEVEPLLANQLRHTAKGSFDELKKRCRMAARLRADRQA